MPKGSNAQGTECQKMLKTRPTVDQHTCWSALYGYIYIYI